MRKILLVLGLLAVVILVMPNAMAKFTGQHKFINGSSVQCTTCHGSINTELHSGNAHNWNISDPADGQCRVCHIIKISGSSLENTYPGTTASYHAAALVECTYCHGQENGSATGYGTSNIPGANITSEFEDSTIEAHIPLYKRAKNASGKDTTDFLMGANEACIACHTYGAEVTVYEPAVALKINASLKNSSDCTEGTDPNCYTSSSGNSVSWQIVMEFNTTL
ncbi:hypothetical protein [Candidatus Pyrohabitans sp.]